MKSAFFEFHVATTGLFTARGNLQVTSHNIANAETPGYARQYAMQKASTPIVLYNGKGAVGTGSEVYGIGQIRDFYLDRKYWLERGTLGEYNVKKTQLDVLESIFNDLSASGLSGAFNDFYANLQSLTENAGSATYRTALIQSAQSLISLAQLQAKALQKQQLDINIEVKAIVDHINSLGTQICSLNKQIKTLEVDGTIACDLRDSRARLVDELSVYVNVEVIEKEMNNDYAAGKYPDDPSKSDKRFIVMINGYELVNNNMVTQLECVARQPYDAATPAGEPSHYEEAPPGSGNKTFTAFNEMDADGLFDIRFINGIRFDIYSTSLKGELKGLIDTRDGNNGFTRMDFADPPGSDPSKVRDFKTTYKGIPHYLNRLNDLVRTFALAINEGLYKNGGEINGVTGHVNGATRENPYLPGGYYFFSYQPNDPLNPSAAPPQTSGDAAYGFGTGTPADIRDAYFKNINVLNIVLNPAIVNDPYKIAAALPETDGSSDESDNRLLLGLLKLFSDPHLFKEGKLSDFINAVSTELGIDIKQATKFESNYTDVTAAIHNQRLSVMGVNMDEEVVNMIKYQQLYQAAAKLINIIDFIYDTTVNRLGTW